MWNCYYKPSRFQMVHFCLLNLSSVLGFALSSLTVYNPSALKHGISRFTWKTQRQQTPEKDNTNPSNDPQSSRVGNGSGQRRSGSHVHTREDDWMFDSDHKHIQAKSNLKVCNKSTTRTLEAMCLRTTNSRVPMNRLKFWHNNSECCYKLHCY